MDYYNHKGDAVFAITWHSRLLHLGRLFLSLLAVLGFPSLRCDQATPWDLSAQLHRSLPATPEHPVLPLGKTRTV